MDTSRVCRAICASLLLCACSKSPAPRSAALPSASPTPASQGSPPSAANPAPITIDGSSTVYPINEAVAEEFQKHSTAKVTIGVSGTGGGFKKFCAGEVEISGASRPIKASEVQACSAANIEYIELPIAYDGLAVVVNPANTFTTSLDVAELKKIWEPAAQRNVMMWNQVRASFPKRELHLFGPGVDSGTYDYFTKAVVGEEHKSRGDYTPSEDDNVLVQGVSRDSGALGFFGLAYYLENRDKLKLVPIDDHNPNDGKGPIAPSEQSVRAGTYQPLSRPVFIYVSKTAAARPEVAAFVQFYLQHGAELVEEARYIPLPARAYELAQKRFAARTTGSLFAGQGSQVGVTVEALLARE